MPKMPIKKFRMGISAVTQSFGTIEVLAESREDAAAAVKALEEGDVLFETIEWYDDVVGELQYPWIVEINDK